jgi:hypothetical protein
MARAFLALCLLAGLDLPRFSAMGWVEAADARPSLPTKTDLLSWPRRRADVFGCFLEQVFGHRDRRFNCSRKGYVNEGDPCKKTKAYYEGPVFPKSKAKEVHPLLNTIDLEWEHGELRAVTLVLQAGTDPDEARS